jgi:5-formyltetrahydrofolate cyclo-ligase
MGAGAMRTVVFNPGGRARRKVTGLLFLVPIVAGWALTLWLTGALTIAAIDPEPFLSVERNDQSLATSSPLYALFVMGLYRTGSALAGFSGGVLLFAVVQAVLLALACVRAVFWLYAKGAPLPLCLIIAAACGALVPLSRVVLQPNPAVLSVVCLLLLTLGLIDAVADNCGRLRRAGPVCGLLALSAALPLLDLMLFPVAAVTLLVLCLTPTRIKGRLGICAFVVLALCLAVILVILPRLGWTDDPLVYLRESFIPAASTASTAADPVTTATSSAFTTPASTLAASTAVTVNPVVARLPYIPPVVVTLGVLIWVRVNRRPRYLLPFVPLITFGVLSLALQPGRALEPWLFVSAFVLCLTFLAQIPFVGEYHDTKRELRERFGILRATVTDEERARRSELACAALLGELRQLLNPSDGYIGLYAARGTEMPVDYLAVQLGALGYRIAYPARLPDTEMSFFTTLGVNDETLLDTLLGGSPFEPGVGENLGNLNPVASSDIAALVVPGMVFDRDRYRVGQGEGYYDHYIAGLDQEVPTWGIGFREQLVESVPVEPHDERLSGIVVA